MNHDGRKYGKRFIGVWVSSISYYYSTYKATFEMESIDARGHAKILPVTRGGLMRNNGNGRTGSFPYARYSTESIIGATPFLN